MSQEPREPNKSYTQEDLNKAYKNVVAGTLTINKAAEFYKVPRSTLGDKVRGKYPLNKTPKTALKPEEERHCRLDNWFSEKGLRTPDERHPIPDSENPV